MGLGPGLHLRQSQSLVMTPQLQQAIKLLALSNLELEGFIAEEVAKNPLLEAKSAEGGETVILRPDGETGDGPPPDPKGSDELIAGMNGTSDSPLDQDWRETAADTDSYSDVGAASDEGFDFDRLAACETGLCEHLMAQLRGAGGPEGLVAAAIVHELEETGYLATTLATIA